MATHQQSHDLQFQARSLRHSLEHAPGMAEASQGMRVMFRLGYAAKGLVFMIIGGLALTLALGYGGQVSDAKGALGFISKQPFGNSMLLVMGLCLLGYVLWRFAQAIFNIERQPKSGMNTLKRIGFGASGLAYLSLSILAIRGFMNGRVQQKGGDEGVMLTSLLLEMPAGNLLVMALGLIIVGVGLFSVYYGISKKFMKEYMQGLMTNEERKVITVSGVIGLPAHGITFAIIGCFFVIAGWNSDASQTKGTKGVLELMLGLPYGTTLLQIIAAGFLAYAVYCFASARFKRFA